MTRSVGLAALELHSTKKDSDLQVGNIRTLEGGTGRAFYTPISGSPLQKVVNIGAVHYGQFQISADSGSGPLLDPRWAGGKAHVFGAGGEASVFQPKAKRLLAARAVAQFGAHTRTQGPTLLFPAAYRLKSLAKPPHT